MNFQESFSVSISGLATHKLRTFLKKPVADHIHLAGADRWIVVANFDLYPFILSRLFCRRDRTEGTGKSEQHGRQRSKWI